jgi:hypothetical protein
VDHAVPAVEVVAYDPAWPGLFEKERRILAREPVMCEVLAEAAAWGRVTGRLP